MAFPRHFFGKLLANDFGLNPSKEQTIRLRRHVLPFITRRLPNPTYRNSAALS